MGVAPDLTTIYLTDYIPRVQHPLPVDGAAMQDACDHHLSLHHTERHTLK